MLAAAPDVGGALCLMSFTTRCIGAALLWVGSGKNSVRRSPSTSLTRSRLQTFTSPLSALPGSSNSRSGKLKLCRRRIHEGLGRRQPIQLVDYQPMRRSLVMATAAARSWRALAFSAGGDGGRRAPSFGTTAHVVCGSERLPNTHKSPSHVRFAGVWRFAVWLVAYVVLGLLLAMFVQSLVNWLLS